MPPRSTDLVESDAIGVEEKSSVNCGDEFSDVDDDEEDEDDDDDDGPLLAPLTSSSKVDTSTTLRSASTLERCQFAASESAPSSSAVGVSSLSLSGATMGGGGSSGGENSSSGMISQRSISNVYSTANQRKLTRNKSGSGISVLKSNRDNETDTLPDGVGSADDEKSTSARMGKFNPSDSCSVDNVSTTATSLSPSAGSQGSNVSPPHFVVEKRNEKSGRALRVTQRECLVGGTREIQTKVDVFDFTFPECPVIFSVKHLHSGVWGRQTIIHKNLLLACMLAEVPSPVEIPAESKRLFENSEQQDQLHTYLERITPFIKYSRVPPGVSLYWWRAVAYGAVVLQNANTGRMLFFLNKERTIPSAVETLCEVIRRVNHLPPTFFEVNQNFPIDVTEADFKDIENPEAELSAEALRELVAEKWALADGVGAWTTNLILQVEGPRRRLVNLRYSIGVDDRDVLTLAIQVHKNEPLVRDLKAYPVCVLQMTPRKNTYREVLLSYKRAKYFLVKLFHFHCQVEGGASKAGGQTGAQPASAVTSRNGSTPQPSRSSRAQSVRLVSRDPVRSIGDTPTRQGARTPPRATPRNRRAVSHLRCGGLSHGVSSMPSALLSSEDHRSSSGVSVREYSTKSSTFASATQRRGTVTTPTKGRASVSGSVSSSTVLSGPKRELTPIRAKKGRREQPALTTTTTAATSTAVGSSVANKGRNSSPLQSTSRMRRV